MEDFSRAILKIFSIHGCAIFDLVTARFHSLDDIPQLLLPARQELRKIDVCLSQLETNHRVRPSTKLLDLGLEMRVHHLPRALSLACWSSLPCDNFPSSQVFLLGCLARSHSNLFCRRDADADAIDAAAVWEYFTSERYAAQQGPQAQQQGEQRQGHEVEGEGSQGEGQEQQPGHAPTAQEVAYGLAHAMTGRLAAQMLRMLGSTIPRKTNASQIKSMLARALSDPANLQARRLLRCACPSMSEETASVEGAEAGVSDEDIWSEDEEEEIWSEEEENIWSEEEEEEMPRETILSEEQESDIWSDGQG